MINDNFSDITVIGFDLDGTLYQATDAINGRIRDEIAKKILIKKSDINEIKEAREYFENRYKELESGSKVLREVGYKNPKEIMDECIAIADVSDLINKDSRLSDILNQLSEKYKLFLLTSSPKYSGMKKLESLGLNTNIFENMFYSDTLNLSKTDGTAFKYVAELFKGEKILYIGDRKKSDILPAKKYGLKTIAVWSEILEADLSLKNIYDIGGVLL